MVGLSGHFQEWRAFKKKAPAAVLGPPSHPTRVFVKAAAHPKSTDGGAMKKSQVEEHTVPWIAALTTYFGYAVLFLFGSSPPVPSFLPDSGCSHLLTRQP